MIYMKNLAVGQAGKINLALLATSFTIFNVLLNFFLLNHSYPLSLYPAFFAFIMVGYAVKDRIPNIRILVFFIILYSTFILFAIFFFSTRNGVAVDFTLALEIVYFLPLAIVIFLIYRILKVKIEKFIAIFFIIIGIIFIMITFICVFPGNFVLSFFKAENTINFVDALVPSELMFNVFLYYHLVVIIGAFGSTSFILGIILYYSDIKIDELGFYCLIICIVFSIYVIGVTVGIIILKEIYQHDKKNDKETKFESN